MTLRTKSFIISFFLLAAVLFGLILFADFTALNRSSISTLLVSERILSAEAQIYKSLSTSTPDITTATNAVNQIPDAMKSLPTDKLARNEIRRLINVKMAFIRIDRLLRKLAGPRNITEPELRQIHNELLKIEQSTKEFIASFNERVERERTAKHTAVMAMYVTGGLFIVLAFIAFYRYSIRPILNLSSQVEAVKEGRIKNIRVYDGNDEIGRLSDFTHQMLDELHKSNESLARRLEIQYATSEMLKSARMVGDTDQFLNRVLEITLSLKWINIRDKGGIYLVDKSRPDQLVLRAQKNFTDEQIHSCSVVPLGRCLCGSAALSGNIVHSASVDHAHEINYPGIAPHGHYCVPIKHEDNVLGLISLYLEEDYVPGEMDIDFLTSISLIIADSLMMKKLAESEHLISRAIEESGEGIMIAGIDGLIEYANPSIAGITGYPADELIGKHLATAFEPGTLTDDTMQYLSHGNIWEDTTNNKRKDGTEYQAHLSTVPVRSEKGEVTKLVLISRDITKEKSLEERLKQAQRMEVIGRFAGGIAHDFNNIVTTITGYGSLLLKEMKGNDTFRNYLDQIITSSKRAANLTRSLLAFGRKQVIDLKPVDLNAIVQSIEKLLLRLIGEDIELRTRLTDKEVAVMADGGQMEQVLMNLASNARDAMPNGGHLAIETDVVEISAEYGKEHFFTTPGRYAMISVTDTGIGMDDKTRATVFEPFFTTKEVGKGTGLGLSIVYGIVKQHEGNITVYSEPGKGTTVKIYLPSTRWAEIEMAKPVEQLPVKGGTETVIVAEDSESVRKLIKKILEGAGYTVMEAMDGEEAVRVFSDNADRVEMLLLDTIMPKKNGKVTYEEIKKIKPEIKALFMSGYTADIINKKGMLDKGLHFISKPVSPEELLGKIRSVLDHSA